MDSKKYKDQVFKIIGAAMAVHRNLGEGLLEPIYNEALVMELDDRGIKGDSEKYLPCYYKKRLMQKSYRMDIVVDDIILELKSVQKLVPAHRAQLFNYLRLTRKPIGLLINLVQNLYKASVMHITRTPTPAICLTETWSLYLQKKRARMTSGMMTRMQI